MKKNKWITIIEAALSGTASITVYKQDKARLCVFTWLALCKTFINVFYTW